MNEYAKSDESHLLRPGTQHPAYRVCGHRGMGRTAKAPAGHFAVWRVSRGSPRPVRCYLYGGATITIESDNWSLQLNTTAKQYRQELGHDGVYAEATLVLDDDGQGSKGDKNDKKKPKESNNVAKIYLNRKIRPQKGHIMRVEHGVSFLISLVFP